AIAILRESGADSIQRLDRNVAEHDWVIMAGETEGTAGAIFAGMRMARHKISHGAQVGVENFRAVQFHPDRRSSDGDFLVIPLADGMLITTQRRDHAIGRTMRLTGINRLAGGLFIMVVQHLAFAHPDISGVAAAW